MKPEVLGLSSIVTGDKACYLGNLIRLTGRVGIPSLWVTCQHRADLLVTHSFLFQWTAS